MIKPILANDKDVSMSVENEMIGASFNESEEMGYHRLFCYV